MQKRLYRSRENYVIGGVAGGLGEYFSIDPTFIRLAFVVFTMAGGAGFLAYFILMIILPEEPKGEMSDAGSQISEKEAKSTTDEEENPNRRNSLALVLIAVGLIALLNQIMPMTWLTWDKIWPVVLIMAGLYLIFRR